MSTKAVTVPRQMWYREGKLRLTFPESWEVVPCLMKGHDIPQIIPFSIDPALNVGLVDGD